MPVTPWADGRGGEGYELDVSLVPAHVKTIRFFNSW